MALKVITLANLVPERSPWTTERLGEIASAQAPLCVRTRGAVHSRTSRPKASAGKSTSSASSPSLIQYLLP
eukprot:27871-Pyramimonas_sp.AAC.2